MDCRITHAPNKYQLFPWQTHSTCWRWCSNFTSLHSRYSYFRKMTELITWVKLQTWKLREEGRLLEIVDPELENYPEEEMLRFIKVALLCTQATSQQRPSMKQVVNMLSNQTEIDLQNVVAPGVLKEPRPRTGGFGGLTADTSTSQSTKANPAESYSTQTNMNSCQFSTTDVSPRWRDRLSACKLVWRLHRCLAPPTRFTVLSPDKFSWYGRPGPFSSCFRAT